MPNGGAEMPIRTAFRGWRSGLMAMLAMPLVMLTTWVILFLLSVAYLQFMSLPVMLRGYSIFLMQHQWFANIFIRGVTGVAFILCCLFITPLPIAVHRYVLMGESARRYSINFTSARFYRYFVLVLALSLIWQAFLVLVVRPLLVKLMGYAPFYMMEAVASYVVDAFVLTGLATLLPAIAIDASDDLWSDAFSRRDLGRVFATFAAAIAPLVLLRIALIWTPTILSGVNPIYQIYAIDIAEIVLAVTVYAATASIVYGQHDEQQMAVR